MSLLCKLFGHKLVLSGENLGLCSAHDCTRCGHHSPAIDWEAIARPLGADKPMMVGHVPPRPMPQPSQTRPAPPMPACKPPAEARTATLEHAHTVVIMCKKAVTSEQRAELVAHAKHSFHQGAQVLVLDSGMPFSAALTAMRHNAPFEVTKRGGPIPHIPQPT